jgi:hypothetical protein
MPERNQAGDDKELGCADIEDCYRASHLTRGRSTYLSGNRHGHLQCCSPVRISKRTVEARLAAMLGRVPEPNSSRCAASPGESNPSIWPPVPSGTLYMSIRPEGDGGHGRLTRCDETTVRTETYATYCGKYGRSTCKFLRITGRPFSCLDIGMVPPPINQRKPDTSALPRSEPSTTPGASPIGILSGAQQSLKKRHYGRR